MSARRWARLARVAVIGLAAAACGGPLLANPPAAHPVVTPLPPGSPRPPDPQPVVLPRDDAPHDRLTEWWYDTGHLVDADGGRWGFEFVVFRAERGDLPVSWASHLALTDETGGQFHYAQRSEIGAQADIGRATGAPGFDLAVRGLDPADPATLARPAWTMRGSGDGARLDALATPAETQGDPTPGFGLSLALAATKPPVLQNGNGYIDFGPAGGSYYYSRTSMAASGTIAVGGRTLAVTGTAWFDHQWGDFIAVGGGWDWFALNLGDGTDVTISLVRGPDGSEALAYGTLVGPDGTARSLGPADFSVGVTAHWASPRTGAVYPAGWTVTIPSAGIAAALTPSVADQELDTRASTGVVYWEGSQRVVATVRGRDVGGQAYVELTGYAPAR